MNNKQDVNDTVDDVWAMISAPSARTQLKTLSPKSNIRDQLQIFLNSEYANESLDVTQRLIVGECRAGGAHSDVYEGRLLTTNIDEPTMRGIAKNKGRLRRHLEQNPLTFKKVAIKRHRSFQYVDDDGARAIPRELHVWEKLQHPNILQLEGFAIVDGFPSFISEWMENGTLNRFISANPKYDVRAMALQIADGLAYLHKNGVVLADLKPDNILVSDDGRPLLSDFGISRIVIESMTMTGTMELKGNVRYMAPELFKPQAADMKHKFHTKESDVWAFGMVIYELLCGTKPFYNFNDMQVMIEIISNRPPLRPEHSTHEYFEEMWKICERCWETNPRHRPKCSELVITLREVFFSHPSKVPVEFKKEGDDWLAIYNPEIPRTLDVELMHTLTHDSTVYCVRFSRDGKYAATGCDRTAQIFDATTGANICVLNDPNTVAQEGVRIYCVCFSPDGKYLAIGGDYGLMQIWDIAEKRIHRVLGEHTSSVCSLDFSRDGRFIVSGSDDTTTRIWDMESDNVLVLSATVPPGVYTYVYSVAISPDMELVAAGCWDGVVRIWDAYTGHLVEKLEGHAASVESVAFTPDGKGLISGSYDQTMKRWDLTGFLCNPDRDQPLSATIHTNPPSSSSSSNSSTLSPPESANSGTAVLAEAPSTEGRGERGSVCSLDFVGHKNFVHSVAVSPDGQWVVSGSRDRDVRIWNSSTAEAVMLLRSHENTVNFVDLNPKGDVLATGSHDRTVRLWRLTKLQE